MIPCFTILSTTDSNIHAAVAFITWTWGFTSSHILLDVTGLTCWVAISLISFRCSTVGGVTLGGRYKLLISFTKLFATQSFLLLRWRPCLVWCFSGCTDDLNMIEWIHQASHPLVEKSHFNIDTRWKREVIPGQGFKYGRVGITGPLSNLLQLTKTSFRFVFFQCLWFLHRIWLLFRQVIRCEMTRRCNSLNVRIRFSDSSHTKGVIRKN